MIVLMFALLPLVNVNAETEVKKIQNLQQVIKLKKLIGQK